MKRNNPKKRIAVAMSGGVDSSVACALLKKEGHEVIGITLKLWTPLFGKDGEQPGGCCSPKDIAEAKRVCNQLDVPHYTLNLEEKFRENVVDNFVSEYIEGKTPNPCVRCNSFIKFDILLKYVLSMNCDALATGHYAQIEKSDIFYLYKALDASKDQSYFLYGLGQPQLSRILFPVGNYTKVQVREIAESLSLITAKKEESQDVCFLEGRSYREFFNGKCPPEKIRKGPIRFKEGALLGEHSGLPYYTIGQRERLGIATGERLYVLEKNMGTNTLVVGKEDGNLVPDCRVKEVNWCGGTPPAEDLRASVKIRYRHAGEAATITNLSPTEARIHFEAPQRAVTPGQSAVFYDGNLVLGGGIIAGGD